MAKTYAQAKGRADGPGRWAANGTTTGRFSSKVENNSNSPKRLKKDWISDINAVLDANVTGLDKCTIDTLTQLYEAISK